MKQIFRKAISIILIQFEGNGTNYYGFQLAEISLNGDMADVDKEMGEDFIFLYYDSIFASATTAKVMVMKHH